MEMGCGPLGTRGKKKRKKKKGTIQGSSVSFQSLVWTVLTLCLSLDGKRLT